MFDKLRLALSLGIALAVATAHAAESPYILPKKQFKQQIGTLSLSPLHTPAMLQVDPSVISLIESEAAERLAKTKINVIGIEPYAQLRTTFANQIGGLTGPDGQLGPRREAFVFDHAKREMRFQHQMDGFAEISLRVVHADFKDDRAEWDGEKQKVESSGDGFSLFGGKNYQGKIAAVSFQLAIYDRSDELLFLNRRGIDVIQERVGTSLMLREPANYLNKPKKIAKAVQNAFKPL